MTVDGTEAGDEAAMIRAGCRTLGILLDPTWHEAIVANVRAIARQADMLLDPPLPDTIDQAPVFAA